jgi:cytochrome c oxidase assembly protein subunit 15
MLLSMALIVGGAVLVRRAGEPDGVDRARVVTEPTQRLTWLLFGSACVAVFTGTIVTGAGPHAGDEAAERLDVAIPTVARIHGVSVVVTILVALAIAWRIRRHATDRRHLTSTLSSWIFVGIVQAAIGYIQYFNGVPELLVGLHIVGATLVMLLTTQVVLDTTRPRSVVDADDRPGVEPLSPASA